MLEAACASSTGIALRSTRTSIGGAAIDATGSALPDETLQACQRADAVLLGAVGGPKWDDPTAKVRPEQGLLGLRRALGLYANLRPVRPHPALADVSPLKAERARRRRPRVRARADRRHLLRPAARAARQIDGGERAIDTLEYTDGEIRRVVRLAFRLASERRRRVTSIDKANVLESSRLWRQTANAVAAEFPAVTLEHQLVDSAAMRLVTEPAKFDVIVTENMFGDILTDEAAVLAGSLGLLPSASLGDARVGLYEPIHGSAPGHRQPRHRQSARHHRLGGAALAATRSAAPPTAARIERAIDRTLADGLRTADLGGTLGTDELTRAVLERL